MEKTIHHGRNVKRFRELLGLKQEALAYELGEEWSQKRVSVLEQKPQIEPDILEQVAKVLKVPAEAIRNFDEETAIFNIQNNYEGANPGVVSVSFSNHHCTINPIEKLFESLEENRKLYERLLQAEQEKNALLQKWLESKA